MRGNSEHGNRETSGVPSPDGGEGRPENAARGTSGVHAFEESDGSIVPQKRANKVAEATAEHVEGSGPAKGNAREDKAVPTITPMNTSVFSESSGKSILKRNT